MKHIWSVLCRRSQIDIDNNNVSLNEVLEQLAVDIKIKDGDKQPEEINIPIDYEVVSLWVKEKSEEHVKADVEVNFLDPTSKKLKTFSQPVEMPKTMNRLRTRFRITGLGLTIAGVYSFNVRIKEEGAKEFRKVSELPLEIHINREVLKEDKNKKN